MKIDVYADIACPWCYIGEKRLEQALSMRPDLRAELQWRPFQLRPEMPKEGVAWSDFEVQKFGGHEKAQQIFARVTSVGAEDGIDFRFDKIPVAPNTLDAHRLVLFAREQGREWEAVGALFAAHFTEGRNVGDLDTLVAIGEGIGLDGAAVRDYLQSDRNAEAVTESQEEAYSVGVEGVPFYVFDERYALSGAQPLETFLWALDEVTKAASAA
ncbi:MAG: DsbA family oxidoreductase [Chloroflexota bacterium]|nr:DsbA family oxidoreductase [Chloroflexota bacterium]MDQ5864441.1 DsbA family oxidoreductase [Chloroflexota bacterium]